MICDVILGVLGFLFMAKILWNLLLPLVARRIIQSPENKSGISLCTQIEVIWWLLLCFFSAVSSGQAWFNNPKLVALAGAIAIVGSNLILFEMLALIHWVVRLVKK